MSRRKDRQRLDAMKRLNPEYGGFRGHGNEPDRPGKVPLRPVTCSVCGRKRNVPVGIAEAQAESYVCAACTEEGRLPEPAAEPRRS